ncbi:SagB-type dehydrogenase family enzyme [Lipingzhangella halophila]|uniref:SagB-type dehydrogenase family enzyme n=1 Tax=Lipingzhangella halophila TaxID=1783352 RepID=A0A7W7RGX3_9ACTN|nr:SagB family peptide dehydrogenase [Lipingzhangella halophila]MBB4931773.1 SagB-type dehydrogenase family enzyme [Lipingzhangella halophila]
MTTSASAVSEYLRAVLHRTRHSMDPPGFRIDWADQPWRHKVYPGVDRLPLPVDGTAPGGTLADTLWQPDATPPEAPLPLRSLAGMLRDSYGVLGRKVRVNGNHDDDVQGSFRHAHWFRGAAAGGGLYPCEIYWVVGPGGDVRPGVYHYAAPHHALRPLLAGNVAPRVRAALGDPPGSATGEQFLLVTVRFWKNAFKYNNFSYHCVTMDVGALLYTWVLWARAAGVALRTAFWFDEVALDDLLGLDPMVESALAVVPLPGPPGGSAAELTADTARVSRRPAERSRTVTRFPWLEEVHRSTLERATERPGESDFAAAAVGDPVGDGEVALPDPDSDALRTDLRDVLRARRSSFGLQAAEPPLAAADLATILATCGHGRHIPADFRGADGEPPLTRLAVFANHVAGVGSGAYLYSAGRHALVPVPGNPVNPFLQQHYVLDNYNLEQVAAVLVVLARTQAAVETVGARAYRAVNAEVGAVAQSAYLVSAALGVGCGVALGLDNIAFAERLGVAETQERPYLLLMIGHERAVQADVTDRFG